MIIIVDTPVIRRYGICTIRYLRCTVPVMLLKFAVGFSFSAILLLVPLMKYPKTGIKEIYGKCLCASERPYKIYPPCFRVLHEGDE